MEFKKCARCGCFFASYNDVCCNCESKDRIDISRLNAIVEEDYTIGSVEELSYISGINVSNLNRFIKNKENNGLKIDL